MADTDLVFRQEPLPGSPAHLVFGEPESTADYLLELSATLPPLTLAAVLGVPVQLVLAATLPPLTLAAQVVACTALPGGTRRTAWGPGAAVGRGRALAWGPPATAPSGGAAMPWRTPDPRGTSRRLAWSTPDPRNTTRRLVWNRADPRPAAPRRLVWGPAARMPAPPTTMPWQAAKPAARGLRAPWQAATPVRDGRVAPWGLATLLPGVNRPLPPGIFTPGTVPGEGPTHIHFCVLAPVGTDLVFGGEVCVTQPRIPDGTAITARSSYVHTHAITAFRLPDMTPVPLTGFTLSADVGSFCWTLEARGPVELLTLLAPDEGLPTLLRVGLDGMTWEFAVEGLRRTRDFGGAQASITGRSVSALLSDPYMPEVAYLNAVPATAQQLINEALQFTDVTLDWQALDWLVPDGAWSFTGTPIAVVNRVAETIGAVVQSPRTGAEIIVAPRYPVLPWDWESTLPDVTIAVDAVVSDGFERADRPAYEGVYVSGQSQGVLALVKRTGTAPALLMPMVTDPLMTDLDAARQRGEALLGGAGPQARMTVTLPVLTGPGEPGVIDVGKLVEVDGWIGLVRAVTVAVEWPTARQTLTIERHL